MEQTEYIGWKAIITRTGFNRDDTIINLGIPLRRLPNNSPLLIEAEYQSWLKNLPKFASKTPQVCRNSAPISREV